MSLQDKLSGLNPQEHDVYLKSLWVKFKSDEMYEALEMAIRSLYRERIQAAAQFSLTADQRTFLIGGTQALLDLLQGIEAASVIDLTKAQYEAPSPALDQHYDHTSQI